MKTESCILVTAIFVLAFQLVRCKDPVSDYDLAITLFTIGNSNHDSQLDESEIAEFYRKEIQFPAPLAEFVAKSMIERGDTNNDNRLSFEETMYAMASVRQR